ncbi:MAG: response regulator transcription factor [Dechloromonas sp.]|nr:MAG: response regulator transcription factor [Dechloromonas sp.]
MKPIEVVLVDDHHLVRNGLVALLGLHAEIKVVGDSGNAEEALRIIGERQPEVVLLDIAMPGMTGFQLIGRIQEIAENSRIIMLSMHADQEHVNSALGLGAHGYVVKNAATEELILAIRTVRHGGIWIPSGISRDVLNAYLERERKSRELTARQAAVLAMTVEGKRTKEIAYELGISVKTVETYRTQIMNKLGIQDIPGLVRYAIRNGICEM